MAKRISECSHVATVGVNSWEDVFRKKAGQETCVTCGVKGPNLWLCLHSRCLYVGCGESSVDHSSSHAEKTKHCLNLNLTTMRIWCYLCESEVFREGNNPPLVLQERSVQPLSHSASSIHHAGSSTPTPTVTPEDSETDDEEDNMKPRGLTGFQNIGNTCYINSALQALSNCPPLTRFFLDCPGFVKAEKKPMLAKSYCKLITEIWHKKRPSYVVPSSIVYGIKMVHPMFRGYTQQDTQEFLRCFMDQLHEELKEPMICEITDGHGADLSYDNMGHDIGHDMGHDIGHDMGHDIGHDIGHHSNQEPPAPSPKDPIEVAPPAENHSDTEYDTCDSGNGSDRGSVANSASSEESPTTPETPKGAFEEKAGQEEKETDESQRPEKEGAPKRAKKNKNQGSPEKSAKMTSSMVSKDSGIETFTSSKDMKESANIANKQAQTSQESLDGAIHAEEEAKEYSEAMAELEPLQGQRSRTISGRSRHSSEGDRTSVRSSSPLMTGSGLMGPKSHLKRRPVQYNSVISDIFDGKILSSVQCLTCERVSSTVETFQDLSLPIPTKDHLHVIHASQTNTSLKGTCGEVSLNQGWVSWMWTWMKSWFWGPVIHLQDCLAAFFSADELKGDNMYSCEKCKKLRNGVKYSKVTALPEVLCIHLKRFRHEFMFSTKLNSYVSFPMENLDMAHYLHKDCKDQVRLYDLVAVICHHGTAGGGHYTAYSLNYLNDQWYEFDDQYVTEVDVTAVENCEAYVLFYRKKNDQMIPLRQKAEQIFESPETRSSLMRFFVSKKWINKFNTFAEPGPITNQDFLCRHGGVHPTKWPIVGNLVEEMPQPMWDFLHHRFEGGPAVNHLSQCATCQQEIEHLRNRQKVEMDTFIQLNNEFQNEENPSSIYAISMAWFKEWENFVRGRTDQPPPEIDNSKIMTLKTGHPTVKMNADYGQLSDAMWKFLVGIYGGGPELNLKPSPSTSQSSMTSASAEAKNTDGGGGDTGGKS